MLQEMQDSSRLYSSSINAAHVQRCSIKALLQGSLFTGEQYLSQHQQKVTAGQRGDNSLQSITFFINVCSAFDLTVPSNRPLKTTAMEPVQFQNTHTHTIKHTHTLTRRHHPFSPVPLDTNPMRRHQGREKGAQTNSPQVRGSGFSLPSATAGGPWEHQVPGALCQ